MNVSMILGICTLLRLIHEVVGGFIPVETRCAETCSTHETGRPFNCDGDYTTCDWQCAAQRKSCPDDLTYHCAVDYEDFEMKTGNTTYLEECALEKPCEIGTEPSITLYANGKKLGKNKARINCIPCSHELFFNSKVGRLSSSYSRCFQPKVNKCIPEDNKIDCGDSWRKLTESDGYCRCDARRGFAPENKDIDTVCFSTYQYCTFTKCPSTQELALNYTCISHCPDGYHRTDDSDACVESASATAKTKPPKTASSTTDRTLSQGTLATSPEKEKVVVSSSKTGFKWKVTGAVLGTVVIVLIVWILITIGWHKDIIWKECHENGRKEAASLMLEKALCQYSSCCKTEDTSDKASSTHNGESQQDSEEEDRSLLSHVEQQGTGVPWKRKIPSDIELWNIASLVGRGWKGLGGHLRLDFTKIDQIEYDNRNNGHIDVVHGVLKEWRKSSSHPTLSDLKDAILQSGVDFSWGSEKLQDIFDKHDQNADTNDTADEGDQNDISNDTADEDGRNAVPNDTTGEDDQHDVLINTEMNNTIDVEIDVHTGGSSVVSPSSIVSTSSTASRYSIEETQL